MKFKIKEKDIEKWTEIQKRKLELHNKIRNKKFKLEKLPDRNDHYYFSLDITDTRNLSNSLFELLYIFFCSTYFKSYKQRIKNIFFIFNNKELNYEFLSKNFYNLIYKFNKIINLYKINIDLSNYKDMPFKHIL